MNIVDMWKKWWHGHGTKILGAVTAGIGILQEIVSYIQAADPKHAALWALIIALGVSTIKRGFHNSAKAAEVTAIPVPEQK